MNLPDVNVLLYAVNEATGPHERARAWLEDAFAAPAGVGFAWIALLGFVRLSTRRGILAKPLDVETALSLVRDWLAEPKARILHPTDRHLQVLGRLLVASRTGGNLTTDAHLAALAIEHGGTLASFDRDFERFSGLHFHWLDAARRERG